MTRTCPACGSGKVRLDGGCPLCLACGWSKCTPVRADGGRGAQYLAVNARDVARHYMIQPRPGGAHVSQYDADTGLVRSGWQAADMLTNDAYWLGLYRESTAESPFPIDSTGVEK